MSTKNSNIKILGLDLGLNNVGFSLVTFDDSENLDFKMGTYVFESPMVDVNKPQDGYKSAQRGRFKRSRKTLQRRSQRKREVYRFLATYGMLPKKISDRKQHLCEQKNQYGFQNPYFLRAKALEQELTLLELGKVISHLNNHRAFLSPRAQRLLGVAENVLRDSPVQDEESKGFLEQISQTKKEISEKGYQTIGQLYADRLKNNQPIRLKTKPNKKSRTGKKNGKQREAFDKKTLAHRTLRADRAMIQEELNLILKFQAQFHPLITQNFVETVNQAIFSQRPIEKRLSRGRCTFFNDKLRIYRASLPAQKYEIAAILANLTVIMPRQEPRTLSRQERIVICNFLMLGEELTWPAVKKLIQLPAEAKFNREPAGKKSQSGTIAKLKGSKTVALIKETVGQKWDLLNYEAQCELVGDLISYVHTNKFKSQPHRIFEKVKATEYGPNKVRFSEQEAALLATLELPKGTLNVSYKFVKLVTHLLLKGFNLSQACEKIGLNHAAPNQLEEKVNRLTPDMANHILHPGVRCAVQNAFRVINAAIEAEPDLNAIYIELPRDIANNDEQKKAIEQAQRDNAKYNEEIVKRLKEAKIPVSKDTILRVKLFDETAGILPYEPDANPIANITEACSPDYEVDHIVPRSLSLQNSLFNLVLCSTHINRQKSGQTPFQFFGKNQEEWAKICAHVNSIKGIKPNKKSRILAKELPEGFVEAMLTATGYISREILKAVKKLDRDIDVIVAPGRTTGFLRKEWGLEGLVPRHPEEEQKLQENKRLRESGEAEKPLGKFRSHYAHHAIDALVVALTSRSMLQRVTQHYKQLEQNYGAKLEFPCPVPNLRQKVKDALPDTQIVHKPNRKETGQLHDQTARQVTSNVPKSKPFSSQRIGNKIYRFDHNGNAFAYYDLGNNHHVSFFKHGNTVVAHVAPLMEVYDRKRQGLKSTVTEHPQFPNAQYIGSLRKDDMVRMQDGTVGYVSKFSTEGNFVDLWIWHRYVAAQIGRGLKGDPYLLARIRSPKNISQVYSRVVFSPFGELIKEEVLFPHE